MTRMVHGTVRGGRIQIEEEINLPEGCEVHLALLDAGDALEDDDRARLDHALRVAQAELARGEAVPAESVLAELRRRHS